MSGRREGVEDSLKGRHVLPVGRSRIDADPALREAVERLVPSALTYDEMRLRLVATFGERRVPSRSALAYYVRGRRIALGYRPRRG